MVQTVVVAVIVALAFAYTAWALMPAAWQRALRGRLGLAAPADSNGCGGCGGGGCGGGRAGPGLGAAKGPGQVVRLYRRWAPPDKSPGKPADPP